MMTPTVSLTMKRLLAIEGALEARLAKPITGSIDRTEYEKALEWARQQIAERRPQRSKTKAAGC